jgi:hypothetical protein
MLRQKDSGIFRTTAMQCSMCGACVQCVGGDDDDDETSVCAVAWQAAWEEEEEKKWSDFRILAECDNTLVLKREAV